MAEVGPDGNVWVIDWYNYIVQHNPTPTGFKTGKGGAYETRPARQEARPHLPPRLRRSEEARQPLRRSTDATPEKLVETLKNDNLFWRRHAQRLLVERGKQDVVPALIEAGATTRASMTIGLNVGVDSRPVDAARPGRARRHERRRDGRGGRGAEAPVGRRAPQRGAGAAARREVGRRRSSTPG